MRSGPPSRLGSPHIASAVLGGWAALAAWRAYRAMSGPTQAAPAATAVVLMVFSYFTQAMSFSPPTF